MPALSISKQYVCRPARSRRHMPPRPTGRHSWSSLYRVIQPLAILPWPARAHSAAALIFPIFSTGSGKAFCISRDLPHLIQTACRHCTRNIYSLGVSGFRPRGAYDAKKRDIPDYLYRTGSVGLGHLPVTWKSCLSDHAANHGGPAGPQGEECAYQEAFWRLKKFNHHVNCLSMYVHAHCRTTISGNPERPTEHPDISRSTH